MRGSLYRFLRNRSIYNRVYRTNLIVAVVPLLTLAIVFSCIYYAISIDWFYTREREALSAYSDNITNELYYFDNTIISISQDAETQNLLLNYANMSDYERYVAADSVTNQIVDQLHMLNYVTDVVLITKDYKAVQAYRGPHGDFYIDEFDYVGLAYYSLSSKVNTVLADPRDYANSKRAVNKEGFTYLKRVNDAENMYFNIGYILVYLDKAALFDLAASGPDEHQYILDINKRVVYSPTPWMNTDQGAALVSAVSQRIEEGDNGFYLGGIAQKGFPALCTYARIPVLNWYVVDTVSYRSLLGGIFGFIAIAAGIIALVCLAQAFISRNIAGSLDVPIKQIVAALHRVETGDFTTDAIEPYQDELATVQVSLNYAVQLLDGLFTRTKENERAKYELHLRALHAQMNPHFLMNALNSAVLLADLQGADNIKHFCRALGSLMQDMLRSDYFVAPISRELSLLGDYTLIMRYRYFDRFRIAQKIEVPDDTLIPRSILQPLIENALQYGMDSRTVLLLIHIRVFIEGAVLYIVVEDDGCGIPEDKLKELLPASDEAQEELKRGSNIGLRNINQRLRLSYGAAYGLRVESRVHEFTRVTVRLPGNIRPDDH